MMYEKLTIVIMMIMTAAIAEVEKATEAEKTAEVVVSSAAAEVEVGVATGVIVVEVEVGAIIAVKRADTKTVAKTEVKRIIHK